MIQKKTTLVRDARYFGLPSMHKDKGKERTLSRWRSGYQGKGGGAIATAKQRLMSRKDIAGPRIGAWFAEERNQCVHSLGQKQEWNLDN